MARNSLEIFRQTFADLLSAQELCLSMLLDDTTGFLGLQLFSHVPSSFLRLLKTAQG